jgi:putative transposase
MMKAIDRLHLDYPFAGARMLRDMLDRDGHQVAESTWPH